ncbi:MAG: Coenzyme F420 hydrogenase/dehydrogenase, beta subunit C-terminal domain [Selenomonadaceae bacterium]|nr:Coenzyme F420 hydrogenase/dehydrogenase, beta subunit C-terminal domain [Selenomonadaceae bacterium]
MKISSVVENNLCVSCGICAGVCPKKCIASTYRHGSYLPTIDEKICVNCGLCHKVCPGKSSTYTEPNIFVGNAKICLIAQTKSKPILKKSSSGGVVTTLVGNLLAQKIYDAAFLVDTYNYDAEIFSQKYSAGSDFISTPKSRYLTVNHSRAVRYMLENRDAKLILVGTSCFVQGILNVIEHFKLRRENYLLVGLFCDKTMNYHVWEHFKSFFDAKNPLQKLYFRDKDGDGWPGHVGLETSNQKVFLPRQFRMQMKNFFCVERCLYCLDKLNQFADISCGDNYTRLNLPAPFESKAGTSNVIIRTNRGLEVFRKFADKFYLHEISLANIAQSQHVNERVKNFIFGEYKSAAVGYPINVVPAEISCMPVENPNHRREYESLLAQQKLGREEFFPQVAASVCLSKIKS